jgi:hypothetical protein
MYLPKHQYKKISAAEMPLLTDSQGIPFEKASAILTSANEYFDIPLPDLELGNFTNAIQLFSKDDGPPAVPEGPTLPSPNKRDYEIGTLDRYFLQVNSNDITEISKELYKSKIEDNKPFEKLAKLKWKLQGPVNDITVNNSTFKGARSVNRAAVMELNNTIKGIKDIVTDYSQFVPETPADKLQENKPKETKTSFDIPSPSKKL